VLPGNTADKTTLRGFLERIEQQYGKARRIWLMDRGVPTEEVLTEIRAADPPVYYLVGKPKGGLTRLEKHLVAKPWQEARPSVQVNLLAQRGELDVLAQSRDRVAKERAVRRRQLKRLWAGLKQLSTMQLTREELLMKPGAARDQIPYRLAAGRDRGRRRQRHVRLCHGNEPSAESWRSRTVFPATATAACHRAAASALKIRSVDREMRCR
jgi:hypothetical protein